MFCGSPFYGEGNENQELGRGFFIHKRIISAVQRVELSVLDRMLKNTYHMKIMFEDFNAKVGGEDV
jgi:hypothetical protein